MSWNIFSPVQPMNTDESVDHSGKGNCECDGGDEHQEGDGDISAECLDGVDPSTGIAADSQSLDKSED